MDEGVIMEKQKNKFWLFVGKHGKRLLDYLIKTMNGMAFGLFSTLIIGVIIDRIGILSGVQTIRDLATILKGFMGIGIGIGIAWSLKLDGLRLIVAGISGGIATKVANDPVVAYLCAVGSIEILNLILRKKTPVDIIIVPLLSAAVAYAIALLVGTPVSKTMAALGQFIITATTLQPFFMGIIIAVVMGMALTAPISSAAIAIAISIGGIAGGAAVVGCCVQMLGFAVMSRKDNNIGIVLSVAFGTSMLQFKNILRKPIIWLPTIIVSAILGPLATLVFKTECVSTGAGMGTSGLVGQFGTFEAMGSIPLFYWSVIVLQFALPILLVFVIDILFRKFKLIQPGDLKI